jgi:hypothetical protein
MHTCRSRMITPYKVYQRRITDNDDEFELVAICEPSGNDRKYPEIILPHLSFAHPNTVKLGKYCPIFSCKHAFGFSLEHFPPNCPEICAWPQSYLHERFSNFSAFPLPPVFNQCILLISRLVAAVTIDSRFCVIMCYCGVKAVIMYPSPMR